MTNLQTPVFPSKPSADVIPRSWRFLWFVMLLTPAVLAQDLPLPVADIERSEPVDYASEIAPIFKRSCLACHHEKEAEGGLILEKIDHIRKGGDSGPGIVAKDVAASVIFARATGAEEPLMPPEDNDVGAMPLTPDELGLIKLWIEQGATGSDAADTLSMEFQPIPESIRTINAIDVSPDGQLIAVGRGNRVSLFSTADFTETATLIDSSLGMGEVADVDLIQSIAFSPDGRRIATGGFRAVRVWSKQPTPVGIATTALATATGLVAVVPDGTVAAIANPVGDIEIWDLNENQMLRTLRGHADRISGLAVAAAADRLFSCDQSGRLIGWVLSSGEQATVIECGISVAGLVTTADAGHVAVIDHARSVKLYHATDAGSLEPLPGPIEGIADATAIVLSDQPAPVLVVATESSGVTLRSLSDNQVIATIDHGAVVDSLAVTADRSKLVTGGRDGTTKLWNLADRSALLTMQGDVETSMRAAIAARDAAREKAALDRANQKSQSLQDRLKKEDEALAKVNEEQQKALETLAAQEQARSEAVAMVAATEAKIAAAEQEIQTAQAAIEAANKAMAEATAMKEQATKELETKQKAVVDAENAKKGTETAIENRKQSIASATAAQQLAADAIPAQQLVIARHTQQLQRLEQRQAMQQSRLNRPGAAVVAAAASQDGTTIATAHLNGDVRLYRASDGLPLARYAASPSLDQPSVAIVGDLIVGFASDQRASVWSRQTQWTLERTIGAIDDPSLISDRVTALDFHRDGTSIAVGSGPPSRAGEVKIFAADTGRVVRDFGPIHSDSVLGVQFSPDGRYLASAAADKTIRLSNIATGEMIKSFEGHTHHVLGVAWQDDGQTLASAGADQTIKLWNVDTGQQQRTIAGFGKEITAVDFITTSNQVASACANGEVRISNGGDGKAIKTFSAGGDFLYTVAVTPDGKQVIAGGHSGVVRIWQVADGQLVAELK